MKLKKAPWQWVASPLGFNMLLSMFKDNLPAVEKYMEVAKSLENVQGCNMKRRIFSSLSSSHPLIDLSEYPDIEKADFKKNENAFTIFVNKYGPLRYHEFSSKTEFIFTSVCTFQSTWPSEPNTGFMKLYNSFEYTQDVNYEGRLLELPLRTEGFKLVLVLPNEGTIVKTLFSTLSDHGLAAAINSIQPLFTGKTELMMPISIDVTSRIELDNTKQGAPIQYGTIAVSDKGAQVKVLTCLYSPASAVSSNEAVTSLQPTEVWPTPPFYFAIVYKDTPIFYGDFNKPILRATHVKHKK
ncbi:uncharacterized protein LOC118266534 isoform X1 [Spodoptera frugiperda]|uniref:Uncharacterized protein LOC118266534 isoform X1 n=2 Tax=Spodoptera frugiperda TaxID=7108 RepID=A0A9R0D070_SPOFR|nr:uncharacterized protein LOC118266534 isoform X1 [Spodoptera frugiperda]